MSLTLAVGLFAQQHNNELMQVRGKKNVTFSATNVLQWTGSGTNSGMVAISWDDATAYVWGVRWNGSVYAIDLLDTIMQHDPRFSHAGLQGRWFSGCSYVDTVNHMNFPNSGDFCYKLNGNWAGAYGSQSVSNGDFMEISASCMFSASVAQPIPALPSNGGTTEPTPTDTAIVADAMLWWAGQGSHSAIVAVNWADTCLAWGVRFNEDSISVQRAMDIVARADHRFAYTSYPSQWGEVLSDIYFYTPTDTMRLTEGEMWSYNVNGVSAPLGFAAMQIRDSDFVKWGDPTVGIVTRYDTSEYGIYPLQTVWTAPVEAVGLPEESTIAADDLLFWVGQGSNRAIVAVNWADTCLAWGVHFAADSITVQQAMDIVARVDHRFAYTSSPSQWGEVLSDIYFYTGADTMRITAGEMWNYNVDGVAAMLGFSTMHVGNGAFIKWGDPQVGAITAYETSEWGTYPSQTVWNSTVEACGLPEESTIAAADIHMWAGSGEHSVIVAVNWADTCLAWGVHFTTDSICLQAAMDSIAALDSRFSYTSRPSQWGEVLSDILFAYAADTLRITEGEMWSYNVNGVAAPLGFAAMMLADGDFAKWGDPTVGIVTRYETNEWGTYPAQTVWNCPVTAATPAQSNAIRPVDEVSISIYPNPVADLLQVSTESDATAYELYDMSGRRVAEGRMSAGRAAVRVADMPAGIYVLRAGRATARVVVKH